MRVITFAWKDGEVPKADKVYDVRHLPNPHRVPRLRRRTGIDIEVQNWLFMNHKEVQAWYLDLLDEVREIREKKPDATLAIGCHGGRHRSVAIACMLYRSLGKDITLEHARLGGYYE